MAKFKSKYGEFQPSSVKENKLGWFEVDRYGRFRIVVEHNGKLHRSFPTFWEGIATLKVGSNTYIAVSEYFKGEDLPSGEVLLVKNTI